LLHTQRRLALQLTVPLPPSRHCSGVVHPQRRSVPQEKWLTQPWRVQSLLQVPQCALSGVERFCSQPSLPIVLQFAKPAVHSATAHAPDAQLAVAFGSEQALQLAWAQPVWGLSSGTQLEPHSLLPAPQLPELPPLASGAPPPEPAPPPIPA
jgi:hypothetical protein